jgi:hypothetical protein
VSLSLQITPEVFFALPNFFAIVLQLPVPKTRLSPVPLTSSSYSGRLASRNSIQFLSTYFFFISTLHGPRKKRNLSVVGKTCLQRRCITTEVTGLLLRRPICWRGNVFAESCISNEHLFWLHYSCFWASCHNIVITSFRTLNLPTTRGRTVSRAVFLYTSHLKVSWDLLLAN